jgi:hypothetical protein
MVVNPGCGLMNSADARAEAEALAARAAGNGEPVDS